MFFLIGFFGAWIVLSIIGAVIAMAMNPIGAGIVALRLSGFFFAAVFWIAYMVTREGMTLGLALLGTAVWIGTFFLSADGRGALGCLAIAGIGVVLGVAVVSLSTTGSPGPSDENADAAAQEADWQGEAGFIPDGVIEGDAFSAPSGNIHCFMDSTGVACTINEFDFALDEDCDAHATVAASAEGATRAYCGESLMPQERVLDYGQAVSNGDFVCTVNQTGVDCWSVELGTGFSVAREGYELHSD